MERNTMYSPGCYHSMIKYMSEVTGISMHKVLVITDREGVFDIYNIKKGPSAGKRKKVIKYSSYNIKVNTSIGQIDYMQDHYTKRWDMFYSDTEFISYEVTLLRGSKEFNLDIIPSGDYKDSLGGGWHQMIGLVKVNDQYFAPTMECAHW